jgi:hypothetical protein
LAPFAGKALNPIRIKKVQQKYFQIFFGSSGLSA